MNWLLVVATATVLFQIQLSWNTVEAGCGGGGGRRKRRSIAESPAVALRSSQLRKRREVSQFINCQQEQALVSQNNTSSTTTIILPLSSASGGVPRPLMVNSTSNFSSSTSPTTMDGEAAGHNKKSFITAPGATFGLSCATGGSVRGRLLLWQCCCGGGGGRRRKRRQAIASFQRHWEFQHPIHSALPLASTSNPERIQLPVFNRNMVESSPSSNFWETTQTTTTPLPPWLAAGRKEEVGEKRPLLNTLIPVLKTLMRWPKRIVDELAESVVPQSKNEFEKSRLLSEKNF
uniref:Secreted protein n=1 Tax=Ditylenchus dipsaci TaxID=166011 RepID=A0A915CXS4_9BILA